MRRRQQAGFENGSGRRAQRRESTPPVRTLRTSSSLARSLPLALGLLIASLLFTAGSHAAGGGPVNAPSTPRMTPAQRAAQYYGRGQKHLEKAARYEQEKAEASSDKKRAKLEKKAQSRYGKAIKEFRKATQKNPEMFQAYSGLGFARRSTGDYKGALAAYDRALAIEPRYAEAIEYRGEAYLELGRLEDAKQAYLTLFTPKRGLADQLMGKMASWLERRAQDPAGVDPGEIEAFRAWLTKRSEIAAQTAALTDDSTRTW